jgi:hypothetical protein
MDVCLLWLLCVLSGRSLCDDLITRPEESYRLWCMAMCDLETLWMRKPWPTGGFWAKKKEMFVCVVYYSFLCFEQFLNIFKNCPLYSPVQMSWLFLTRS